MMLRVFCALILFALYAPLLAIVWISFAPEWYAPGQNLGRFAAYQQLFADDRLWLPTVRSLLVAGVTAVISVVLGTAAAMTSAGSSGWIKRLQEGLIMIPLALPEIVFGMTLLVWFMFLRVSLGSQSIILAHVTFCVSYVYLVVLSRWSSLDPALFEAAKDLGASPWQTLLFVKLPLLAPGLAGAALLSFALSFDDFLITYFVSGVGNDTLPVKLYSMIKFGFGPSVYALSAVILVVTAAALLLGLKLSSANVKAELNSQ